MTSPQNANQLASAVLPAVDTVRRSSTSRPSDASGDQSAEICLPSKSLESQGPNPERKVSVPGWMRQVLLAAAVYNVLWGLAVIVWPQAYFRFCGMADLNYPQIWQCVGMIVGVYGIGYAVAASDPIRHWPIVLVGFLGKIFGPLGMLQNLLSGELPWRFATTLLTNDLIWWVPFALILRRAFEDFRTEANGPPPEPLSLVMRQLSTSSGESLAVTAARRPTLLVLVRHLGCTFCREMLDQVRRARQQVEAQGVQWVLVQMGSPESLQPLLKKYGLQDLPVVHDPEGRLYRGLGLPRGTLWQLLGPKVWWRGFWAFYAGHGLGGLSGDGFRLAGAALIANEQVLAIHKSRDAADHPDFFALAKVKNEVAHAETR